MESSAGYFLLSSLRQQSPESVENFVLFLTLSSTACVLLVTVGMAFVAWQCCRLRNKKKKDFIDGIDAGTYYIYISITL